MSAGENHSSPAASGTGGEQAEGDQATDELGVQIGGPGEGLQVQAAVSGPGRRSPSPPRVEGRDGGQLLEELGAPLSVSDGGTMMRTSANRSPGVPRGFGRPRPFEPQPLPAGRSRSDPHLGLAPGCLHGHRTHRAPPPTAPAAGPRRCPGRRPGSGGAGPGARPGRGPRVAPTRCPGRPGRPAGCAARPSPRPGWSLRSVRRPLRTRQGDGAPAAPVGVLDRKHQFGLLVGARHRPPLPAAAPPEQAAQQISKSRSSSENPEETQTCLSSPAAAVRLGPGPGPGAGRPGPASRDRHRREPGGNRGPRRRSAGGVSGSERTSYASEISWKRRSAAGSLLTSGW